MVKQNQDDNRLQELFTLQGQSPLLDNLRRDWLTNGELQSWIDRGIRGVTSNPSIFQKAIEGSNDYDQQFFALIADGFSVKDAYWELVTTDINGALDVLQDLYVTSHGKDGFVSVEVDPSLAHDTKATTTAALDLSNKIDRPNLMVKIPGTEAGLPSIRKMTSLGKSVNVTLIFSVARYQDVVEAYISGLEDALDNGKSLENISSVASFFISRIDTAADNLLTSDANCYHKIATSNAYNAYKYFIEQKSLMSDNFQKLLWASTSVKSKDLSPEYYCINLPMLDTVNTLPPETINHLLTSKDIDLNNSLNINEEFEKNLLDSKQYFNLNDLTDDLLINGIKLFQESYISVLEKIEEKIEKIIKK